MAKNLFLVTMAAKISVLIEAKDEKEAKAAGAGQAAEVFGKSFGILTVVGDAKALALAEGKASKAKVDDEEEEEEDDDEEKPAKSKKGKAAAKDDDEEEDDEEEEEDDEEEEEEEDDEEEEEEDDEEEEKPAKSKKGKKDEKAGKTKIKLKLKS